jgi:hypothetical protein
MIGAGISAASMRSLSGTRGEVLWTEWVRPATRTDWHKLD